MTVLSASSLCKSYKQYRNGFYRVLSWFGSTAGVVRKVDVLKNVSFELRAGEALGIVGVNGAGKSTLLKIVTSVLKPTSGSLTITGNVSAILELGMGFSPDLTGEENVYRSAGLMGFSRAEIKAKLEDIEEFADIGENFQSPVRVYSSGMKMRLAFAVATSWRPDLLIIDEALAVGDILFQQKCAERIKRLKQAGAALLFVSHDKAAVMSICDRAILLQDGLIASEGEPAKVLDFYNATLAIEEKRDESNNLIADVEPVSENPVCDSPIIGHGSMDAVIVSCHLTDAQSNKVQIFPVGGQASFIAHIRLQQPVETLVIGLGVRDRLGNMIFGTNTHHTKQSLHKLAAGSELVGKVTFQVNLAPGEYSVQVALTGGETHLEGNFHWIDSVTPFSVINQGKPHFVGQVWNEMTFDWLAPDSLQPSNIDKGQQP